MKLKERGKSILEYIERKKQMKRETVAGERKIEIGRETRVRKT